MMRLSLMHRIVQTVDENRGSLIAEQILAAWGYDNGTVKFARASANFLFSFQRNGNRYFLRFNGINERNAAQIADEIKLLNHLLAVGLQVSQPVLSGNHKYVETVDTDLGTFVAVVFKELMGQHLELKDMKDEGLKMWGAALGRLHAGMRSLPLSETPNRYSWENILDFASEYVADDEDHLKRELEDVREALAALPRNNGNYGLVHFDFECDNLIWNDNRIAALDFDDSARLWYVADICYALRDLFKNKTINLNNPHFQLFLKGYRSETSIDEMMLQNLPLFMRFHRLFFIARLRRSVDIVDTVNAPKWLVRLGDKLNNYINAYISDIKHGIVICR